MSKVGRRCANARCSGRPSAPPRSAASAADEVRGLARDYGSTQPAAIRLNYGMQRVHGGGNAVRLIALLPCLMGAWRHRAGGLLLSSSGWFRGARRDAWLQRPDLLAGRTPRTINMVTIGDDLLRESSPAFGPADRGRGRLQQQPGGGGAGKRQGGARLRARGPVHGGAGALPHRHRRPRRLSCCRPPRSWSTGTCTRPTATPTRCSTSRRSPRWARRGRTPRSSARWRRAWASRTIASPTTTRRWRAARSIRGRVDLPALREHGWARLTIAEAPFADGGFPTGQRQGDGVDVVAGPGRARPRAQLRKRAVGAGTGGALSAGDDLAAGAPLPQLQLRQRAPACAPSKASRCSRSTRRTPPPRGIADGAVVRVFNDRGEYLCKAEVSERARPGVVNGLGVWWRKFGAGRHQRQPAHAPAADRHRPRAVVLRLPGAGRAGAGLSVARRALWLMAGGGVLATAVRGRRGGLPGQRLQHAGLLRAGGRRPPRPDAALAAGDRMARRRAPRRRRCASACC